jgi:hypothetical protein
MLRRISEMPRGRVSRPPGPGAPTIRRGNFAAAQCAQNEQEMKGCLAFSQPRKRLSLVLATAGWNCYANALSEGGVLARSVIGCAHFGQSSHPWQFARRLLDGPAMRRLDPAQSAAAKGQAAIQLILAGPGSGKTSTLTGRFVHLIRQGVDPARILAVTFTKKAADEMRHRIARLLELPSPSSLHVMTFHAFAFRLLKKTPGVAGLSNRFRLFDAPEQRHIFSSRRMWWNEETDILDIIGGAKERLLDADGFAASIDRDDETLVEAVEYFRVYQQALRDAGAIDFADMVPLVVKAMNANESYCSSITSAYDHMLVDEYQDVNPGSRREGGSCLRAAAW